MSLPWSSLFNQRDVRETRTGNVLTNNSEAKEMNTTASTTSTSFVDIPAQSLTINKTATYLILLSIDLNILESSGTIAVGKVQIVKNSTVLSRGDLTIKVNGNGSNILQAGTHMSIHTIEACDIGDTIKVQWQKTAGTTLSTSNLINSGGRLLSVIELK